MVNFALACGPPVLFWGLPHTQTPLFGGMSPVKPTAEIKTKYRPKATYGQASRKNNYLNCGNCPNGSASNYGADTPIINQ